MPIDNLSDISIKYLHCTEILLKSSVVHSHVGYLSRVGLSYHHHYSQNILYKSLNASIRIFTFSATSGLVNNVISYFANSEN